MVERSAHQAINKVIKEVIAKHKDILTKEIEEAVADETGRLSVHLLQTFASVAHENRLVIEFRKGETT